MTALPRGILSPEERQYAMYQGLLSAGPMLLAAGAPTNAPGYSAQAMAGAGQAFQGGMQNAYAQKMQGLQLEEYLRQQEQEKAWSDYMAKNQGLLSPDQSAYLQAAGPEVAMGLLGEQLFPGMGEGYTLGAGEVRFDADGNVIARGPEEPVTTATIEQINGRDVEVKRDQNGNVIDFAFAPVGTTVTNVIGGEDDTAQFLFDRNTADANATYDQAKSFSNMLPDLAAAEAAIAAIPEGSLLEPGQLFPETRTALARAASMLGVEGAEGLGAAELLTSINSRMAPLMRAAGSGSTSDMEFSSYIQSLPSMVNSRDGNLRIIAHIRDMASFTQKMSEIKTRAIINTQGNPSGYEDEVKRLTVEVFGTEDPSIGPSFSELVSASGDVGGGSGGGTAGGPPAGVTQEEWDAMTAEERKLWLN